MNAELEIMPVDHSSARAEQVGIMPTDTAVPKQVDDLMDVLGRRLGDLAFVWAAPPCGTASKAQGRPIPNCPNALPRASQMLNESWKTCLPYALCLIVTHCSDPASSPASNQVCS